MPTYKVKPETFGVVSAAEPSKAKPYYPTVYLPVSKEIIKKLAVGKKVKLILAGEVEVLESRESEATGSKSVEKHEVRISLRAVELSANNAYEEMADDEDD